MTPTWTQTGPLLDKRSVATRGCQYGGMAGRTYWVTCLRLPARVPPCNWRFLRACGRADHLPNAPADYVVPKRRQPAILPACGGGIPNIGA